MVGSLSCAGVLGVVGTFPALFRLVQRNGNNTVYDVITTGWGWSAQIKMTLVGHGPLSGVPLAVSGVLAIGAAFAIAMSRRSVLAAVGGVVLARSTTSRH